MRAGVLAYVVAIALTACGRWGFDEQATDDGGDVATDGDDGDTSPPDGELPEGRWASVAMSDSNACGITREGALWCWGANFSERLAPDASGDPRLAPTRIGHSSQWTAIALDGSYQCGIDSRNLYCWGQNIWHATTIGPNDSIVTEPTQVGNDKWLALAVGGGSTCAVRDDHTLWCWGRNENGKLGIGTQTGSEAPAQVGTETDWTAIGMGVDHACGLRGTQLYCWGANYDGQVGNAAFGVTATRPVLVGADHTWTQLAVGSAHTCAITDDGTGYCWGANWDGRLGNGTQDPSDHPVAVDTPALLAISTADSHACGLTRDTHELLCWGNATRDIAPGHPAHAIKTPVTVATPFTAAALHVGGVHTCVIDDVGHLACAGTNNYGEVGAAAGLRLALEQADTRTDWTSIAASFEHACGITAGGGTYCWGSGFGGEIGDGAMSDRQVPALVGTGFTQIGMGIETTVARKGTELWLWGHDAVGDAWYETPALLNNSVRDFATGGYHGCWSDLDGTVHCGGDNKDGQLGGGEWDGDETTITGNWQKLYAAYDISCGTLEDGSTNARLYCWGRGDMVGSPQSGNVNAPVRTDLPDVPVLDVQFGNEFACALVGSGQVWCWGDNYYGELGDGSFNYRASPSQVGTRSDFIDLDLGDDHACAITSSHELWCWGHADEGQAGALTSGHPQPVQVPGSFRDVAAGTHFTCAIATDGTRWCGGENNSGQLGNGHAWTEGFVLVP